MVIMEPSLNKIASQKKNFIMFYEKNSWYRAIWSMAI